MKTHRPLATTAFFGSLLLTAPAHAFLLDGFGNSQAAAEDFSDNGAAVSTTRSSGITDTDFTDPTRTLTAEMTNCGRGCTISDSSIRANIGVDGLGNTFYDHDQDSGVAGYTEVIWDSFGSASFPDPVVLGLNILTNDVGGTITLELRDSGGNSVQDSLSIGGGVTGFRGVTLFSGASDFTDITFARMRVDGNDFLDLTVDVVETPAPGVLALIGLGLVGLAFFPRRRQTP